MADGWLLRAALERRQEEQLEQPTDDGARDPEAIVGPLRCEKCGGLLVSLHGPASAGRDNTGRLCRVCWEIGWRVRRPCLIEGCHRPARSNGRCRKHTHGDPEFWGWVGPKRRNP
jgi:hypothetical protein